MGQKAVLLKRVRERIRSCRRCSDLSAPPVPPEGYSDARIVVIGRNPGKTEFQVGRPFIGRGGELLNKELRRLCIPRENLWITNAGCCFAGVGDRPPSEEEFDRCYPYLRAQLRVIKPSLVISLGKPTTQILLKKSVVWSEVLGVEHEISMTAKDGDFTFVMFPVTHPGQALRGNIHKEAMYKAFNTVLKWVEINLPDEIARETEEEIEL